jgi:hypothetical protein
MGLSGESTEIQALAGVLWTDEVKQAWLDHEAEEPSGDEN